ncbi:hypothetical protein Scep_027376 [Stephania cephalantha]|uniref:Uncharacterized protein n=1 Tax=Stephania cephalantha TaxID=152367 RepID=A0AAP0E806_9MAGN
MYTHMTMISGRLVTSRHTITFTNPAYSPGVGDEHTSTSRRPQAPHRHSSVRSSNKGLRSSIPRAIEEIPDFFRPPTAPAKGENPLIYLIAEHGLYVTPFFRGGAGKMSLVFKTRIFERRMEMGICSTIPTRYIGLGVLHWDLQMSFAIYDVWCRKASISTRQYISHREEKNNTYLLNEEVFEHYKRMRATDETFKKKYEQMSTNRKSEVGGSSTGISLHSAGSISTRQHGDTLEKKLQRRPTRKEMFRHLHTHGHDGQTFVDQRSAKIDVREASSSRGPAYGPHELEELQRDHQRVQETLLNERMERQEQMQRDKMERQEENREMQDRLARMKALLMQHLGIRPHVPPTPRTPPSPVTERSRPHSDDQRGHLTTDITHSQSAHPDDHQPGHWTEPHISLPEDQRHLLDDHDEFISQLTPPPRPPPRQ